MRICELIVSSTLLLSLSLPLAQSSKDQIIPDNDYHDGEEFEYSHGGDDWHHTACKKGKRQSPIDLPFFEEDIARPIPRDYVFKPNTFLTPTDAQDDGSASHQPLKEVEHHIFEPLHTLYIDAQYGEIADVVVENLTDTVWVDIKHIDGTLTVHEDNREDEVFRPL